MSRRIASAALTLVVALLFALPAAAVTVEKVVSPKGIEAWLVQDHANPILSVEVAFRGGAALDPAAKAGLATLTAGLLDEGAGPYDSLAFQSKLEDLAIELGFDAGRDTFRGHLKTLTDNRDTAFEMFRLAMNQPRFDKEPVERVRSQILTALQREQQSPETMAARSFYRMVFPGHPYAVPVRGTPETVKAVAIADLKGFVKANLARDRLVVGVVGDITPAQLAPLLDATFGGLPAKSAPVAVTEVIPKANGQLEVIARDNPQSVALFGQPGIKRDDPDWYAAYVVNYVLGGGGFSSRLTEEVREKRGLAYSVSSFLAPMDHAGLIMGSVATENARVAESLDLIRAEWKRMHDRGPTPAELADAKTYLTGSFPLQMDSVAAIAGLLVQMQLDRLGIDYLDKRNALIQAVTPEQATQVAARLFDPARLTTVVVGKPAGLTPTQ